MRKIFGLSVVFGVLVSSSAWAQVPKSAQDDAKVTGGATELTDEKATTMGALGEESKDATELSLSAGGLLSTGNARLFAGTANSKFRLRRSDNQFSAAAAVNYGRAAAGPDADLETNVENYQGTARYDRFFGDWTVFLSTQARRDRFQGLNLRGRVDPGVGYYFINEKTALLWTELGYDFLIDLRRADSLEVKDDAGNVVEVLDDTEVVHSGRLFLGFDYAFHDSLKLALGVEFMQGISDTDIRRLNGTAEINAKIEDNLALAFGFTERYDSAPLPGKEELDTITTISIVYTLL
ncbi:MAG: YdiY family protein [Polyangiaceae bacterium]